MRALLVVALVVGTVNAQTPDAVAMMQHRADVLSAVSLAYHGHLEWNAVRVLADSTDDPWSRALARAFGDDSGSASRMRAARALLDARRSWRGDSARLDVRRQVGRLLQIALLARAADSLVAAARAWTVAAALLRPKGVGLPAPAALTPSWDLDRSVTDSLDRIAIDTMSPLNEELLLHRRRADLRARHDEPYRRRLVDSLATLAVECFAGEAEEEVRRAMARNFPDSWMPAEPYLWLASAWLMAGRDSLALEVIAHGERRLKPAGVRVIDGEGHAVLRVAAGDRADPATVVALSSALVRNTPTDSLPLILETMGVMVRSALLTPDPRGRLRSLIVATREQQDELRALGVLADAVAWLRMAEADSANAVMDAALEAGVKWKPTTRVTLLLARARTRIAVGASPAEDVAQAVKLVGDGVPFIRCYDGKDLVAAVASWYPDVPRLSDAVLAKCGGMENDFAAVSLGRGFSEFAAYFPDLRPAPPR